MKIKEIAYSAQQHLQVSTGVSFKRAHMYELLAASFGFNSYAAFGVDTVLTEHLPYSTQTAPQSALIKQRCIELGYQPGTATLATATMESFLAAHQIGVASISSLVSRLRGASPIQDGDLEYDHDELFDPADEGGFGPILLEGLEVAASKGNPLAHYALALMYDPGDDVEDRPVGRSFWHSQRQQGRALTGVEKEWADAYEAGLIQAGKYTHHLKEAGRLGNQYALLDLAERFDDPSFFEQTCREVDADPAAVASIAERMGLTADARHWLTVAAESGDTDAMLQLIEEYDHADLQQCWTWVYLSKLVGTDLTQDAHYAVNEDGSEYDDDVGGPAYVGGRDGVDLEALGSEQDIAAKLASMKLFEQIELKVV
jgi:TPR repeat protein